MTYSLEIDVADPIQESIDNWAEQIRDAVDNITRYRLDPVMHEVDVDVHELLADHEAIGIVWDVSHVRDQRPDLTAEQAWEVLQAIEYDRLNDLMRETIRLIADNLYPSGKESLRRRVHSLLREIEALPEREADDPAAYGEAAAKLDAIEMNVKGA